MSPHGLTSRFAGANGDSLWSSDSETHSKEERHQGRLQTSRSTTDLFGDVYRGIKKKIPSRDESSPSPTPSGTSRLEVQLPPSSGRLSPAGSITKPLSIPSRGSSLQHGRNLSLQINLEKPLPEPPPIEPSTTSPTTPRATGNGAEHIAFSFQQKPSLNSILENELNESVYNLTMDSGNGTMDSQMSAAPFPQSAQIFSAATDMSGSQTISGHQAPGDGADGQADGMAARNNGQTGLGPSPNMASTSRAAPAGSAGSAHLSGLMCNVHRTTGREPHPLVGATTTILGDKLYVFGGRILSRSRPAPLTSDLYELDLIRRHWTKVETTGDLPPPRYFHSMCALGDTKMVCYGGMSPTPNQPGVPGQDQQPEVTVMSDIYIYDATSKTWTFIPTQDTPQGRYAHCACILPSSATFSSHKAPLSALQHNPSSGNPNEGRIGISIDGSGGAEMIVVGGQDGANHYIEQISVFNLRSLKWTSTQPLGKSCGAYRSVVAPLPPSVTSRIGKPNIREQRTEGAISQEAREPGSSMLIYSNYNFLDVKLELQIRGPDGTLAEKAMTGTYSPPGLRFPNGGVIDTYFVVSGTYLTSSKQEYALWALDLKTLTWSRIDAGGSVFSQGSWNRGVLWNRRNTFVILGNRKRSLVDDYNHRRINFSNICMVELEAFGFYDNPRKTTPLSGFVSASSPYTTPGLSLARKAGWTGGGRFHSRAAEELGEKALMLRELADMDILAIGGERIPINSRIVGRRWGPYFVQLLREGAATHDGSDSATLRTGISGPAGSRMSALTITQSTNRNTQDSAFSNATTLNDSFSTGSSRAASTAPTSFSTGSSRAPSTAPTSVSANGEPLTVNSAPTPASLPPNSRPRCLYLPHTYLTIQSLLHFLYTSSLPAPSSPLCTPQILCSLLQIARPYKIDGLLEAVVDRLHALLDSRNAAAVFNATAMAAGGGRGIDGSLNPNFTAGLDGGLGMADTSTANGQPTTSNLRVNETDPSGQMSSLRINTSVPGARPSSDELSASTSVSGSEWSSDLGGSERGAVKEVWSGELSSVIGLQKRGLRGLMEGRRMRANVDRSRENDGSGPAGRVPGGADRGMERQMGAERFGQNPRVGLGIAGGAA